MTNRSNVRRTDRPERDALWVGTEIIREIRLASSPGTLTFGDGPPAALPAIQETHLMIAVDAGRTRLFGLLALGNGLIDQDRIHLPMNATACR